MIRLANTPMNPMNPMNPTPHASGVAQSVPGLFSSESSPGTIYRPIPEPNPEPNPKQDAALSAIRASISPDDWDELFRTIVVRLESCVDDALIKEPELSLHSRHEVTKKTVLECVESMKQLHASLSKERQAHGKY